MQRAGAAAADYGAVAVSEAGERVTVVGLQAGSLGTSEK